MKEIVSTFWHKCLFTARTCRIQKSYVLESVFFQNYLLISTILIKIFQANKGNVVPFNPKYCAMFSDEANIQPLASLFRDKVLVEGQEKCVS